MDFPDLTEYIGPIVFGLIAWLSNYFGKKKKPSEEKGIVKEKKEVKIINYLNKLSKSVSIDELQLEVWGYHSKLETHTVETHIYRLRKKVLNKFNNENFIISKKDGYQINLN